MKVYVGLIDEGGFKRSNLWPATQGFAFVDGAPCCALMKEQLKDGKLEWNPYKQDLSFYAAAYDGDRVYLVPPINNITHCPWCGQKIEIYITKPGDLAYFTGRQKVIDKARGW